MAVPPPYLGPSFSRTVDPSFSLAADEVSVDEEFVVESPCDSKPLCVCGENHINVYMRSTDT